MSEINTGPELEACGWYVRTKRTDVDTAGWLVADCSTVPHGKEYARLFAASPALLAALSGLYELVSTLSVPDEQYLRVTEAAAAIALATQAPEAAPESVRVVTIAGGAA
ncbi:conserved hypothetical protein [Burkholderia diffusa]|uniref:hypothetical protein n=1 Tax=Burkholderia diffusa TaxID=488732 RepID=UPI001CB28DD1|nr:hypothetical protein [Burkholderia diffusa]CAG9259542.1 conserved hypothetical protein [Burkholderia diffusa]